MIRFRITDTTPDGREQTWVLLPDAESARMQALEHAQRSKHLHVRVYREETEQPRELVGEHLPKLPKA